MTRKFDDALKCTHNINAKLSTTEKALRWALINQLVDNPEAPILYEERYESLLHKDIINRIQENKIGVIYPFSFFPTNYKVLLLDDHKVVYAMCAIDALGIYYSTNQNIRIHTECMCCKESIIIEVKSDKTKVLTKQGDIRVLYVDLTGKKHWCCNCCNQMHFFKSNEALENYLSHHIHNNQKYFNLSLDEALKIAKELFQYE